MEVVFCDFHLPLCIIGDKSISKAERNVFLRAVEVVLVMTGG